MDTPRRDFPGGLQLSTDTGAFDLLLYENVLSERNLERNNHSYLRPSSSEHRGSNSQLREGAKCQPRNVVQRAAVIFEAYCEQLTSLLSPEPHRHSEVSRALAGSSRCSVTDWSIQQLYISHNQHSSSPPNALLAALQRSATWNE